MQRYDIAQLQRQLENLEDHNDSEAQKLYNNLGLAYLHARRYRHALNAHRREKAACKRLVDTNPDNLQHRLDLAIAYRRCGDVILKLDRLVDAHDNLITDKAEVIRAAHKQHRHALQIARAIDSAPASLERQAASAAIAHSALALAMETKRTSAFRHAAQCCIRAAGLIDCIDPNGGGALPGDRNGMTHGLAVNFAIALSGMGEKKKAKTMLHAVVLNARRVNDMPNFVRAIANLAEEAGDEDDWSMCQFYSRQWVQMARQASDEPDESDALRKLAVALRETQDFRGAKEALERAIVIAVTRDAADEARGFLEVIEQDMDDYEQMQRQLAAAQRSAAESEKESNFVEEAKHRLTAGNHAFALKKWKLAADLLQRYFVLVDEFGCNTAVTDIPEPVHNSAVANVAEAMWRMRKYEQAVKWASRELAVFDGDDAGQAQAWCNLGVYLDDFGNKQKAIDALQKSMFFADKAAQEGIFKRAQTNLELIQEDLQNAKADGEGLLLSSEKQKTIDTNSAVNTENDQAKLSPARSISNAYRSTSHTASRNHDLRASDSATRSSKGEKSVMIISTQPAAGTSKPVSNSIESGQNFSEHMVRSSVASKNNGECAYHSRSQPSRGGTVTADRSSYGFKRVTDLVTEYKKVCGGRQSPTARVQARIVRALRALSSVLIARDACEESSVVPIVLNLSCMLLNNDDISAVFETLSKIGYECSIHLNLSFNPTATSSAYDCLNPRSYLSPSNLHCLRELNLSCSGLSGHALRILANALSEKGSLSSVLHINVSKNALGRQARITAFALARLLLDAFRVEQIDISNNLLPNSFVADLVDSLASLGKNQTERKVSSVRKVSFVLNNRRCPSALLDVDNPQSLVAHFAQMFTILSQLEVVDVRACGANGTTRRLLRGLNVENSLCNRSIITVSEAIMEETDNVNVVF
ncbi:Tetratricopeptide repeat containing protein [Gracilaria domingensis]|nr:Tetratricopeptide repeat containing protein [Gracilaria domingensis]